MRRFVLSIGLVGLGATAALAAPQAPLQAPTQAPGKAVQAPVQKHVQSPVQKGGVVTARADGGYRTYSYQPGEYYSPAARSSYSRSSRPSYLNAGSKAAGRY
jgi:hypothetical protein